MRALILNCTLKPSPEPSNTDALASVVVQSLTERGVECEKVRVVDHDVKPGVETDMGAGDEWPAGVVVTGNEDGAHHVIAEIAAALADIGYTIPGQAWTYWNKGPGRGASVVEGRADLMKVARTETYGKG